MKKLINFFVQIWAWIVSLFTSKVVEVKSKPEPAPLPEKPKSVWKAGPIIPPHNNRKRSNSRHIQVDPATGRTIYHGAK